MSREENMNLTVGSSHLCQYSKMYSRFQVVQIKMFNKPDFSSEFCFPEQLLHIRVWQPSKKI